MELKGKDKPITLKKIGNYTFNPKYLLGEGAYSKVFEGHNQETGQIVAIKQLDQSIFKRDEYLRKSINKEIEILKKLNHCNIMRFIDYLTSEKNIYLITEYCSEGDLRQLMAKKRLSIPDCIHIMKQLLNGFSELVKNNVIHRDLKPANILIDSRLNFKIADFGFSTHIDYQQQNLMMKSAVGTPLYMSPQILMKQHYTMKSDIWSLGVIFYEMISGCLPYIAMSEQELLKKVKQGKINLKVIPDEFCKQIIIKCLKFEEKDRITWDQLFNEFESEAFYSLAKQHSAFSKIENKENNQQDKMENQAQIKVFNKQTSLPNEKTYQKFGNQNNIDQNQQSDKVAKGIRVTNLNQSLIQNAQKNQINDNKNQNVQASSDVQSNISEFQQPIQIQVPAVNYPKSQKLEIQNKAIPSAEQLKEQQKKSKEKQQYLIFDQRVTNINSIKCFLRFYYYILTYLFQNYLTNFPILDFYHTIKIQKINQGNTTVINENNNRSVLNNTYDEISHFKSYQEYDKFIILISIFIQTQLQELLEFISKTIDQIKQSHNEKAKANFLNDLEKLKNDLQQQELLEFKDILNDIQLKIKKQGRFTSIIEEDYFINQILQKLEKVKISDQDKKIIDSKLELQCLRVSIDFKDICEVMKKEKSKSVQTFLKFFNLQKQSQDIEVQFLKEQKQEQINVMLKSMDFLLDMLFLQKKKGFEDLNNISYNALFQDKSKQRDIYDYLEIMISRVTKYSQDYKNNFQQQAYKQLPQQQQPGNIFSF